MNESKSSYLRQAKENKNDEFYTQLKDIDNELKHYKEHFKWKVVFCNCDDPYESNFFKYFAQNFNFLWLKKLIATWYSTSPIAFTQLPLFEVSWYEWQPNRAYKIEISEVYDANEDWAVNLADVEYLLKTWKWKNKITLLKWDWDFRSQESIDLLKMSDIVVTNPPFSLFREYVCQLMEYKKQFIILGNMNAIAYKEFFPLLKDNKIWAWFWFNISMVYKTKYINNLEANRKFVISKWFNPDEWYVKVPAICWYTNMDIKKRHENMILYKKYNKEDYPKYYNYDAIDVSKVSEIPCDYFWEMWVPITFLEHYCENQFEIIWIGSDVKKTVDHIAHKDLWIINYEKNWTIFWSTPYTVSERKIWNSLRIEKNGLPSNAPYNRILIRRKK